MQTPGSNGVYTPSSIKQVLSSAIKAARDGGAAAHVMMQQRRRRAAAAAAAASGAAPGGVAAHLARGAAHGTAASSTGIDAVEQLEAGAYATRRFHDVKALTMQMASGVNSLYASRGATSGPRTAHTASHGRAMKTPTSMPRAKAKHKGKLGFYFGASKAMCKSCKDFFTNHVHEERKHGRPIEQQSNPRRFQCCLECGMKKELVGRKTSASTFTTCGSSLSLTLALSPSSSYRRTREPQ